MKLHHIKKWALATLFVAGLTSCEGFLDRPAEDNYNVDNYYQTDDQCYAAVNPIYNSPWYDFQRFYFKAGEIFSGNLYSSGSPYMTFTVNSSDADLVAASAALWAVNGYCNATLSNLNKVGNGVSEQAKLTCKGECLTWKAMTYFFLVRTFGAVPIIHDSEQMIADKSYNAVKKAKIEDVYDYIIMTLEQAIEWLPETDVTKKGRIDKYAAMGLLAKVYLTKSGYGQTGTRNADDLANAAYYAKEVIENSGRKLMNKYEDIFRLEYNVSDESLIAWRWTSEGGIWTAQNTLQSDLGIAGFSEFGDCWGGWNGVSVDLQEQFGEDALSLTRVSPDARRKATMMMIGDKYSYFWKNKGGFDVTQFIYNPDLGGPGEFQSNTGANCAKHLYGNASDHLTATGISAAYMSNSLATHLLRLGDVYLIYAEAMIGNNASTTDASAIDAYYQVRSRGVKIDKPTSVTWEQVWKERRLELALECDRWYDYVRLSYYNMDRAINEIKSQKRNYYEGLNSYYKLYYESGSALLDPTQQYYNDKVGAPNVTASSFTLPFPDTDMAVNPNLMPNVEPVHVDISQYSY